MSNNPTQFQQVFLKLLTRLQHNRGESHGLNVCRTSSRFLDLVTQSPGRITPQCRHKRKHSHNFARLPAGHGTTSARDGPQRPTYSSENSTSLLTPTPKPTLHHHPIRHHSFHQAGRGSTRQMTAKLVIQTARIRAPSLPDT